MRVQVRWELGRKALCSMHSLIVNHPTTAEARESRLVPGLHRINLLKPQVFVQHLGKH